MPQRSDVAFNAIELQIVNVSINGIQLYRFFIIFYRFFSVQYAARPQKRELCRLYIFRCIFTVTRKNKNWKNLKIVFSFASAY